ncbi:CaiB/BaiF CoA transferase family protein [Denitrobaculum tricleocarpae]|uniref:CoA transferase n=1 Tax=Denitrobaculum tricleocarpae TaxID=2591009 RepID=A0A545TTU7_9PROT|nr:CoA transferase [Denitrobaculum tricleocarpae]TQV80640.1 CoA transferase [Denitrobaculum tricleocarpae]
MTDNPSTPEASGPLAGLRVFDLTRILAGPTCTQLLGDLGADIIKIERPGQGDDTRKWGPPYIRNTKGEDTKESAYYLSSNRNKRSLAIDISKPEGQALAKRLIAQSDILVENYKVGGLAKYGLSYDDLKDEFPGLIYCSITGFGQTGPYAPRAGYDYLAQGIGGIMSLTGESDGAPMKVGVGIADVMCGMYASSAILAALHHRTQTGKGQQIDLALLDTQVSWLVNEGLNYLTSGKVPTRLGNEHANIVPYKVMPAADGFFILAVGNDRQFKSFCDYAGAPELAEDPRFATNSDRVKNREALYALLPDVTKRKTQQEWVEGLADIHVPSGPVNTLDQVFEDPQIRARGMKLTMPYPESQSGEVDLIANPIKYSGTPVTYRRPPPTAGQHSEEVLQELLELSENEIAGLRDSGVI